MTVEHIADIYNSVLSDTGLYNKHPELRGGVVGFIRDRKYEKDTVIPYLTINYSFIFVKGKTQYILCSHSVRDFTSKFDPERELSIELEILTVLLKYIEEHKGIVPLLLAKMEEYDKNKQLSDPAY